LFIKNGTTVDQDGNAIDLNRLNAMKKTSNVDVSSEVPGMAEARQLKEMMN
jgi:hypothetical protein